MDTLTIFGLQLILSLIVYTLIAKWYVSPWLAQKPINIALMLLVFPHAFRHIGLTFFIPGIVSPSLPTSFAYMAAYGDLVSGLLAIFVLVTLRRNWNIAFSLVWIFNIIGTADLLTALSRADAVPHLWATWYIPTFWVPLLLVTHGMIFIMLIQTSTLFNQNRNESSIDLV